MAVVGVFCPYCNDKKVVKNGKSIVGEQRYKCQVNDCRKTFQLTHRYNASEQGVRERIVDMAMNGSGIRDTARVLSVGVSTVISTLKKSMQSPEGELGKIAPAKSSPRRYIIASGIRT